MDDMRSTIIEEPVTRPLFKDRPNDRCCWPMWGDHERIENKRCCGALVSMGSKIPYCAEHLQRQTGAKLAVKTGGFFLKAIAKPGA